MKKPRLISYAKALLPLVAILLPPLTHAQEKDRYRSDNIGFAPEYTARHWATTIVLPIYPEEALKKGATGVVEVRVGFNERGEVEKVKVPPGINPLFRKAVVAAAKQWNFGPSPTLAGTGVITTSRLTFRFFIQDGEGRAELFDPPWGAKGSSRIRESYSSIREWEQWEDETDDN